MIGTFMRSRFSSTALKTILQKYGVTAAYLFGSHAHGRTHKKSDIDIAVRFQKKNATFKKILHLSNELSKLFSGPVDLVPLDSAPLPLQFRIFAGRELLYAKKPKEEILKQAKSLSLYHDFKYYYDRFTKTAIERMIQKGLN